jgi:hypothetical protein
VLNKSISAISVKLTSPPIKLEVVGVTSKQADLVTDDQWNAYRGMKGDNFPEVPPDGERGAGWYQWM